MDFSLSNHYDFQRYINNSHLAQSNSESIRTINNLEDLQSFFSNAKETNMLKLFSLQQRFNECLTQLQLLQEETNSAKSQFQNEDKVQFQLERYEGLLHHNFQEIQWAKTERMSEHNFEIPNSLSKFQKMLERVQQNLRNGQAQQQMLQKQLFLNLSEQFQVFHTKIDKFGTQFIIYKKDVKICIEAFNQECQSCLDSLELKMKDLNQQLMKKIDNQLSQIDKSISLLKH